MKGKTPVGVLISGSGTNLQALLDACQSEDYPARIAVVISNRPRAYGLERAQEAGIPTAVIPAKNYPDRQRHEQAISDLLHEHGVEWVACAGYMRILSAAFVDEWAGRTLNIHPALLPAFPGLDGQGQALTHGVQIAGATVHLVTEGSDTGPIIVQGATGVLPNDTRDSLQERILALEHILYPRALRWAVEGRILPQIDNRVDIQLAENESRYLWHSPTKADGE